MTPAEPGLFGRVVGTVTGKVVDAVPIDRIIEEVDVDALLERVDVNRLLDRIDVDHLLDRVDVERLLARVDIEELVQRAGVADVVTDTTGRLAGRTLDVARRELAGLDTVLAGIVDRLLRRRGPAPVGPLALIHSSAPPEPDAGAADRATVTGRYAGPISRSVAGAIDLGVILASYSIGVGLVGFLSQALFGLSIGEGTGVVASAVLLGWAASYVAVSTAISGRTVGKGTAGLTVVSRTGYPVRPLAAVVRMLAFPLSTSMFAFGLILIALRRDHPALHDLIARTAVVYDWGDRPAQLPGPLTAYLRARDAV